MKLETITDYPNLVICYIMTKPSPASENIFIKIFAKKFTIRFILLLLHAATQNI